MWPPALLSPRWSPFLLPSTLHPAQCLGQWPCGQHLQAPLSWGFWHSSASGRYWQVLSWEGGRSLRLRDLFPCPPAPHCRTSGLLLRLLVPGRQLAPAATAPSWLQALLPLLALETHGGKSAQMVLAPRGFTVTLAHSFANSWSIKLSPITSFQESPLSPAELWGTPGTLNCEGGFSSDWNLPKSFSCHLWKNERELLRRWLARSFLKIHIMWARERERERGSSQT